MKMAKRLGRLGTENAFVVLAQVTRLKEEGKDIINFGVGEPDFDTPSNIKRAGISAIENNMTHYSSPGGLPDFKRTVADYISKTRNIEVGMDEVVITPGVKPMIFYSIHALVDEGDEVLYPNPGYPIYESVINFVGGKAVPVPLLESKGFSFDIDYLEKAVTGKTKLIILNSPQNPTGGILSESDLEKIADIANKKDLWVLSDEIYSRVIYGRKFNSIISIPGMKERTVLLDGFSKIYAMTGWRLGYGIMNKALAEQVTRLETNCDSCTATFTQLAGIEAYTGPQTETEKMVKEFKERRDIIVEGLNNINGIKCLSPEGAFYVFPNVTEACKNLGLSGAEELKELLLHEGGVAVLPRTSFGNKNIGETEEYIRLSYATSKKNIMEGLKRIKNIIENNS